jgi:hypothetical protein
MKNLQDLYSSYRRDTGKHATFEWFDSKERLDYIEQMANGLQEEMSDVSDVDFVSVASNFLYKKETPDFIEWCKNNLMELL